MNCSNCGATNDADARFCTSCAHPTPTPAGASAHGAAPQGDACAVASVGNVIDGKYRIEGRIAAGGMGTVYRATRLLIGDQVAIKLLHRELVSDEHAAERFRREAQAAARLKHPNAVSVYDFGVTGEGLVYLVMELVEGESLREIIKARGPLPAAEAAEIARQVCAALDEAHGRHVVHRDVKPDNIVVSETARGLRVKVLDFGVAKLRDLPVTAITQTGSIVGTPHYMSPEQCLGEELDHRSDIYSLGIVLYEMLAGVVPFNSPISTAVIIQHVNQPPPPLRLKNGLVTAELERVVLHALEKQRDARPQTAVAFAEELTAALNGRTPRRDAALFANDEGEVTREASRNSGSQSAQTEVLRPPAAGGGPLGQARPETGLRGRPKRTAFKLAAAAALLLAALGGFTLLTVWPWQGSEGQGKGATRDGGRNDSASASPEQRSSEGGSSPTRGARTTSPARQPPPGMVSVRGGVFTMGSNDGDTYERPAHRVTVSPFYIDQYEVTCAEYARFLRETDHPRVPDGWAGRSCAPDSSRLPVTGVTWDDAVAYARWAGKRLPTEEEWEFAARGTDGRRYPWGEHWRAGLANADAEGASRNSPVAVGQLGGASPFEVFDMAGNVWEWTASPLAAYPGGQLRLSREGDFRVIRGGSWDSSKQYVTTSYRGYLARTEAKPTTGFRCAKDAAQ